MTNKVIGIVASVAMAVIGTALLVFYVRGADDRAAGAEGSVEVLVASEAIPKGTKAEELAPKVRLERVPSSVAAPGGLTSLSSLDEQVTLVELGQGDQLVPSRFGPPAVSEAPGVPPGLLQVTIPIDTVRAVGGQLRAGDTVGVVASFEDPRTSRMILHKVKVTGVRTQDGQTVSSEAQGTAPPAAVLHVTLALEAGNVERVVFAAEYGKLWLSAEPENAPPTPTRVQTKETVNA
jgi:pilus assembly protein CpaB